MPKIIIIIIRAFVRRTMLASELNLRRRNPTLCTNTTLEQYTHTPMGEHSLGVCVLTLTGGVPPPIGGVNNSLVARRSIRSVE